MNRIRLYLLLSLILIGGVLITFLYLQKIQPPTNGTLAPIFERMGKPIKAVDHALSKVMSIDDVDEALYGEAIAARYKHNHLSHKDSLKLIYLNDLVDSLQVYAKKTFDYQAFLWQTSIPNAYALPGGIIVVTNGLLNIMESEAELVSVLAHEMGHIEKGHCLDAVKYQLALEKMNAKSLGKLADFANSILLRHSYSKTQENDADEYAYDLILETQYDPRGVGGAFNQLEKYQGNYASQKKNGVNVLRDYFSSHPPLTIRKAKFMGKAKIWWNKNPKIPRYHGSKNLQELSPFHQVQYENEWRVK